MLQYSILILYLACNDLRIELKAFGDTLEDMHSKILSSKHFRYDKASKVSPKSFNSILRTLQARYDISIEYCNKRDSARLIHDILYYHAREYLKNVSIMKDKYIVMGA